jgi:uncharacterized metal-binding protein
MTTGKNHDRAILLTTPIVGFLAYKFVNGYAAHIAIAHLVGGLALSPDLDTNSKPLNRWWLLKFYWYPYRDGMKHRGSSHDPIIGTLGRVLYLCPLLLLICFFAKVDPIALLLTHPIALAAILAGLEISAWVHLFCDGILLKKRRV